MEFKSSMLICMLGFMPVNGALHYASYVNYAYDVVAVAVSGVSKDNYR